MTICYRHDLEEKIHLDDAGCVTSFRCLTRVSLSVSQLSPAFAVVVSVSQGSRIPANQMARNGAACTISSTTTVFLCCRRTPSLRCNHPKSGKSIVWNCKETIVILAACLEFRTYNVFSASWKPTTLTTPLQRLCTLTTQMRHLSPLDDGEAGLVSLDCILPTAPNA